MRLDLDELNSPQRDAVTTIDGPVMILAGAGTGKTRVITYRLAYMLGAGIPAESIVALSFTNKAAKEMSERVRRLIGERAKKSWLGTFHSFCLSLLRRFPNEAGLTPGFSLAGTADQLDLVRKGLEEKNWAGLYHIDQLHHQIGMAKNQLLTAEDLRSGKGVGRVGIDNQVLSEVFDLYERQLRLNRVIDFDDCIYKTVLMLRRNPSICERIQREYRYFMVDEYQDTNTSQLAVLELLASSSHDVCVVGDDDQSIYSWRGAMYEVLERFEQLFPNTRVIKLEQNYRCSNVILDAANTVIRNNQRRKEKTLWSASQETAPIVLSPCEDETAEANLVAEKCISLMGGGLEPRDVGILYRANKQSTPIELALREARLPYRTYGGQSFFEKKEVKDFVCYLRLVLDSEDRLALWRIVNTPNRGIGLKTLERIEDQAKSTKLSPFQVMRDLSQLNGKAESAMRAFVQLIDQLRELPLDTADHYEALGLQILKLSGLEQGIRLRTEDTGSRERKISNLRSLPKWFGTLARESSDDTGNVNVRDLLDSLALDNDRKEETKDGGNHISLMTIHASKGLEFPAVFVIGLEEEQLPHKNSIQDPQALCEERRLFYVALTRAKKKLHLSYCLDRSSGYQGKQSRQPSRFLDEVPAQTFLRSDDAVNLANRISSENERKAQTAKRLGSLRESLNGWRR
ncbi:MAG: ATP-dependent DNA helicase PcrA [Deltaproteobacteria bacterium]|nr:ATP-dependent DNA helicase PcrA [Deltaproteobacteria bacterium]